jgi:hypothetical protein
MKKTLSILVLAGCFAATLWAADNKTPPVPVLIELFTSEGCSSCPPADAWLQQLDLAQPITGAQLIVLSEHVDYWNHDGWKDPFSSALVTQRQEDYERAFRLDSAFTPQIVVNGSVNLKLGDSQQIKQTFLQAAGVSTIRVTISGVSIAAGDPASLHANVMLDANRAERSADIYAAVALSHAESQVLKGENGGKRLMHVAVVQELIKIGRLEKGKTFNRPIDIKLKPGTDPKNIRLIVFAQEPGPGKVLGAALQESIQ